MVVPRRIKDRFPLVGICLLVFLFAGSSMAAVADGYAGMGIGSSQSKFDANKAEFAGPDVSPSETAWRVFGGGRFLNYLGVEAGYIDLGDPGIHEEIYEDFYRADLTGLDVTAVGYYPVIKGLSVFAKGGLVFWKSEMTFRFTPEGSGADSKSGSNLVLGLGARYDFYKYFGVRAEFTRYAIDKTEAAFGDINYFSVSGLFSFGIR